MASVEGDLHFQRPTFQLLPIPSDPDIDSQQPLLRSLPDLVHFNAIYNPQHVFCLQSSQSQTRPESFDFTPITYRQLACAVESCCSWILRHIPSAHAALLKDESIIQKAPPIALFLESDVGLFIYMIALLTLNIPCVLLSIRLNPTAVSKLLNETGASSILISSRTGGYVNNAFTEDDRAGITQALVYTAASFDYFMESTLVSSSFPTFVRCRQFVREDDQNVIILHSSGTTGLPKAIPLAHRYLLGYAACHQFPPSEDESRHGINLSTLPLFHGFGVLAPSLALSVGKTVCFPPPSTISNGTLVLQMIRVQGMTSLMTVPSILEDVVRASAGDQLAPLDFVVVGGGPIKNTVAETLHANGVKLLNHFGATELGALAPIFRPDKSYDWRYLRLRTDMGLELKRIESPAVASVGYKIIGRPFGSKTDFELQDNVEINPVSPEVEVKLVGRKDDLIVLATGEKISPQSMENFLEQDSRIKRAIVFGTGQFEIGVLLEPASAVVSSEESFIESIWPVILDANDNVDRHAQITTKAAVLLKPKGKSLPLSDKGSPQRKEVYLVFEPEIRSVYNRLETIAPSAAAISIDPQDPGRSIREIVQPCLPQYVKPGTWRDEDDFVQLGVDSLQATRLRRTLNQAIENTVYKAQFPNGLPQDFVYMHSSVERLIEAFEHPDSALVSPITRSGLLSEFSERFSLFSESGPSWTTVDTILLTGTTGNLGSHLLQVLSEHPRVPHVVCLVRENTRLLQSNSLKPAISIQQKVFDERGIKLSQDAWSKIKILDWQPERDRLGLEKEDYHSLASTITHIFHGAWPMDFQMKVSSFELQMNVLQSLVNLARFAHRLRPVIKPRVILASSIAVVGNYAVDGSFRGMVPEIPLPDPRNAPLAMGYAEAKWVCEQMMESAYSRLQYEVQPMIVRIGQLTGSQASGYWSVKEHIPALVKSSVAVGHLPDLHGTCSWLPVDQASSIIADLLLRCEPRDLVYHLENPVRKSWPEICSIIEYNLGLAPKSRLPFSQWLERVSKLDGNPSDLMDFFRRDFLHMSAGSLILDTRNCQKLSPTLRSVGSVGPKEIEMYMAFWRRAGLF